jgi:hypothetical protein
MNRRPDGALFEGFFLGGFECSIHKLEDGRRLDLIAATSHDAHAAQDYARLRDVGMTACRDGVRWTRVEAPGVPRRDFSSVRPMIRAAAAARVQVIWDLMHFGWPDDVDIFSNAFPARFAAYARAFAEVLAEEGEAAPFIAPVNEMSFIAWAGGDVGVMNPFLLGRGVELKVALVRASLAAIDEIRAVLPHARFLQPEPIIRIHPNPEHWKTWRRVECDDLLQFQAWDMLTGRVFPWLGGDERYLDVIGVNFYWNNQFMLDGSTVEPGDPRFVPLSRLLLGVWERYRRPMIVSETGHEGDARAGWLRYVVDECARAMEQGVELHGITLYPVLNHPGWLDDRHIENGLWDYPDAAGERAVHAPLAAEIRAATPRLVALRSSVLARALERERRSA